MDDEFVYHESQKEGIKRLAAEILLRVFNDILSIDWYQYYTYMYLKTNDVKYKTKLSKHFESIEWLLSRDHWCFMALEIENYSDSVFIKAIYRKFYSDVKFQKITKNPKKGKHGLR